MAKTAYSSEGKLAVAEEESCSAGEAWRVHEIGVKTEYLTIIKTAYNTRNYGVSWEFF